MKNAYFAVSFLEYCKIFFKNFKVIISSVFFFFLGHFGNGVSLDLGERHHSARLQHDQQGSPYQQGVFILAQQVILKKNNLLFYYSNLSLS